MVAKIPRRAPWMGMTTHANHRSASSPRPTPEGPTRDNPIAGPRTGTTRSEPSAPASAGASSRHNEPGSRLASACPAQPPSKAGGLRGKRHHGVGKADRSTESDQMGQGAAHHAGQRGTAERHAAGPNQGTRTGAKQRRPPGAANPESAHNTQRTTTRGQVASHTSCRPDRRERARQPNPAPAGYGTAAVRMDACVPRGYPTPAGYKQPPSRWTSARPEGTQPLPATKSHRPDGLVSTPQRRSADATHSTTHRASTPVNRGQVAQDTAQHTGQDHR